MRSNSQQVRTARKYYADKMGHGRRKAVWARHHGRTNWAWDDDNNAPSEVRTIYTRGA